MTSDVWSFGVVFWEILSIGRVPYAGGDPASTINDINNGYRLPSPDEIKEVEWLVECYNVVAKMSWNSNPTERSSFTEVAQIFETYLTEEEKENYLKLEQNVKETAH